MSPASVLSKLLELRADVNGSEARGGLGDSALVNLTWESKTVQNGGAELAALLVSARANGNAPGRPTGLFRLLELGFRAAVFLGSRSSFASFHANSSSCALGYAALSGYAPMVSLLLASRAEGGGGEGPRGGAGRGGGRVKKKREEAFLIRAARLRGSSQMPRPNPSCAKRIPMTGIFQRSARRSRCGAVVQMQDLGQHIFLVLRPLRLWWGWWCSDGRLKVTF